MTRNAQILLQGTWRQCTSLFNLKDLTFCCAPSTCTAQNDALFNKKLNNLTHSLILPLHHVFHAVSDSVYTVGTRNDVWYGDSDCRNSHCFMSPRSLFVVPDGTLILLKTAVCTGFVFQQILYLTYLCYSCWHSFRTPLGMPDKRGHVRQCWQHWPTGQCCARHLQSAMLPCCYGQHSVRATLVSVRLRACL